MISSCITKLSAASIPPSISKTFGPIFVQKVPFDLSCQDLRRPETPLVKYVKHLYVKHIGKSRRYKRDYTRFTSIFGSINSDQQFYFTLA